MARPSGPGSAPRPPRKSAIGQDAVSEWLHADDAIDERFTERPEARALGKIGAMERDRVVASVDELGRVGVSALRARTGLGQVRLGIVLERLQAEGRIRIEGMPGREVVNRLD